MLEDKNKKNKDKPWQQNIIIYVAVGVLILVLGNLILNALIGKKKESKINIEHSEIQKSPLVIDSSNVVIGENINIYAKIPQRHITKKMITQIELQLKKYNRKDAVIFFQMGDSEARKFASEIFELLKSKGLEVDGPLAGMFPGDPKVDQWMFIDEKGFYKQGILVFSIETKK